MNEPMIDQAKLDALDPLDRATFDASPVVQWRVTWPDSTSEVIKGHFAQTHSEGVMAFHFIFLGVHRIINLQHVRDVERLS